MKGVSWGQGGRGGIAESAGRVSTSTCTKTFQKMPNIGLPWCSPSGPVSIHIIFWTLLAITKPAKTIDEAETNFSTIKAQRGNQWFYMCTHPLWLLLPKSVQLSLKDISEMHIDVFFLCAFGQLHFVLFASCACQYAHL